MARMTTEVAVTPERAVLADKDVRGLKYLRHLLPLFARLHEVGCERDKSANRKLHFDQYCALVMLYLFNPLIDSMRALQHASELPCAKKMGLDRFSLGSFSEAPGVFDPERLREIIGELATEARPLAMNPRLSELKHALTLTDSTVLEALPRLARAACAETRLNTSRAGHETHAHRLHTQLDLKTFQPNRIECTGASRRGDGAETAVLLRSLEPDRCYVGDGGYYDTRLFDGIVNIGSSFVMRVREDCVYTLIEERELTDIDRAAGIRRDLLVNLGTTPTQRPVRLLIIEVPPHPRRTRKANRPHGGSTEKAYIGSRVCDQLMIATNLTDLPADLVGLIYRQRYSVELFFRFLKHLLGMRHLLSHRTKGVEIQTYCALIACLLINLQTGRKPNKRMMETLGWYLLGLIDEQAVVDELNKADNTGVKLRAKEALWKKMGA